MPRKTPKPRKAGPKPVTNPKPRRAMRPETAPRAASGLQRDKRFDRRPPKFPGRLGGR